MPIIFDCAAKGCAYTHEARRFVWQLNRKRLLLSRDSQLWCFIDSFSVPSYMAANKNTPSSEVVVTGPGTKKHPNPLTWELRHAQ